MTLQKQAEAFSQALDNLLGLLSIRGGPGSGHRGHRGRLGEIGGSEPGKGAPRAQIPGARVAQQPEAYVDLTKGEKERIQRAIAYAKIDDRYNTWWLEAMSSKPREEREGLDHVYISYNRPVGSWMDLSIENTFYDRVIWTKEPLPMQDIADYELAPIDKQSIGALMKNFYESEMTHGPTRAYVFYKEVRETGEYRGGVIHPTMRKKDAEKYPWRLSTWDFDGFSGHTLYSTVEEALGTAARGYGFLTPLSHETFDRVAATERFTEGVAANLKRWQETENRSDADEDTHVLLLIRNLIERGGRGSGHRGHRGRPGEVGGSLPAGAGALPPIPADAHRPEPADQEKYLYRIGERVVMNWGVEGRVIAYYGGPPDPLFYIEYLTGPDAGLVRNHPHSSFKKEEDVEIAPTVSWEYDEYEAFDLEKASIKEFGETENPLEAGYILSEGQMLDFSGKSEGGPAGMRSYDHRDIGRALPDDAPGGTEGMYWFMSKTGAIRMGMYDTDFIIDFSRPPTSAQDRRVRELLEWKETLVVDIKGKEGGTLWSISNQGIENPERIWNDVKRKANELLEERSLELITLVFRGGPGSGHRGHRGRLGEIGGSEPGKGPPRARLPGARVAQQPQAYAGQKPSIVVTPSGDIRTVHPIDETKTGLWLRGKEYLMKYGARKDPDAGWYFSAFELVEDRDPLFAIDKQGEIHVGLTGHEQHLDLLGYGDESIRGFATWVGNEPVLVYYKTGQERLDMLFRKWEDLLGDMGFEPDESLSIMITDDAGWSMRFPTSEDAETFPPPEKYRSFIEKGGPGSAYFNVVLDDELAEKQREILEQLNGLEPVPSDRLHITLLYIEQCDKRLLEAMAVGLSKPLRFDVEITGLEILGEESDYLTLTVNPSPGLIRLHDEVLTLAAINGLPISDFSKNDQYKPHISIAQGDLSNISLPDIEPFKIGVVGVQASIEDFETVHISPLEKRGGEGSGHRGHVGRPGEVGGSQPKGAAVGVAQAPEAYTERLSLTKTNVGKVIKWSTSRYNEYKKKQVVDWAYDVLKNNRWQLMWKSSAYNEDGELDLSYLRSITGATGDIEIRDTNPSPGPGGRERVEVKIKREIYSCGAYTPSSAMVGADYLIDGEQGYIAVGFGTRFDSFEERERYWFETGVVERGGPGSGHRGHRGRLGEVGGSEPGKGAPRTRPHRPREFVRGLDPIRLPAGTGWSEAYDIMKKEVKGFRLMTTDKETGERVILRDMDDALDQVAEKLRHLDHEEFYLYTLRGQDIYEVGSETMVEMGDDEIALMQMLDRRYDYPDPVASIHNHPPSYAGQSFPPSFSDLRLMIKYGHTELHVVVPDGRWVVSANNQEIPKDFIYGLSQWWNDYADRRLYSYFSGHSRADVGTFEWNQLLKTDVDAASLYAEFANERVEAMGEEFSETLEVQWQSLTNQE